MNMYKCILHSFFILFIVVLFAGPSAAKETTSSHKDTRTHGQKDPSLAETGNGLAKGVPITDSRLRLFLGLQSEGFFYDNADLRDLDESTAETIEQTDDRQAVALSFMHIGGAYSLSENLHLSGFGYYPLLWGRQMGSDSRTLSDPTSNTIIAEDANKEEANLVLSRLFFVWHILKQNSLDLVVVAGRQEFAIGFGDSSGREYLLHDVVDALVVNGQAEGYGRWKLLVIDWLYSGLQQSALTSYGPPPQNDNLLSHFAGDVHALRSGLVYQPPPLTKDAHILLYAFGMRYGATPQGGAERSRNGLLGNTPDRDYLALMGVRPHWQGQFHNTPVALRLQVAYSHGSDRRQTGQISLNGLFAGIRLRIQPSRSWQILLGGLYAQGPEYNNRAELTNYGFVGFRGDRVGSLLMGKAYGSHPFAYAGSQGFVHENLVGSRASGLSAGHFAVAVKLSKSWRLRGDYWWFSDTGKTQIDQPESSNYLPYRSQARMGETLGEEISLRMGFVQGHLGLSLRGAVFLPGAYFAVPSAWGGALQGDDPFWGIEIAARVRISPNPDAFLISERQHRPSFWPKQQGLSL